MGIKALVKKIPVLGSLAKRLFGRPDLTPQSIHFDDSGSYWDRRYATGGNSGAGSYGRLAKFKAEFLNNFVQQHRIRSVIEFGSGDGAQLGLARYPDYVGVDVSPTVVAAARKRYEGHRQIRFIHTSEVTSDLRADLSLSLDVIYHLVEDEVFDRYMNQVFDAARKAVIIYASNKDEPGTAPHVRHRKFTDWAERNRPDFMFMQHVPNEYPYDPADPHNTSFADFYLYSVREPSEV